jgi:hypothetical protein
MTIGGTATVIGIITVTVITTVMIMTVMIMIMIMIMTVTTADLALLASQRAAQLTTTVPLHDGGRLDALSSTTTPELKLR